METHRKILPASLALALLLSSCTTTDGNKVQRRQVTECPGSMVLICEGSNKPSSGGEEETPAYDRCYCRSRF